VKYVFFGKKRGILGPLFLPGSGRDGIPPRTAFPRLPPNIPFSETEARQPSPGAHHHPPGKGCMIVKTPLMVMVIVLNI